VAERVEVDLANAIAGEPRGDAGALASEAAGEVPERAGEDLGLVLGEVILA
jgi:hypothetical protein